MIALPHVMPLVRALARPALGLVVTDPPPPAANDNGWFFDEPAASGHLLTSGIL
jgi:hypothetical protein